VKLLNPALFGKIRTNKKCGYLYGGVKEDIVESFDELVVLYTAFEAVKEKG